jgi:hypothetical protein
MWSRAAAIQPFLSAAKAAPPVFWAAAVMLPALAFLFAAALRRPHWERTL